MMNLNIDVDYFIHPKTEDLVCRLGEGAELYPLKLWAHVARFHPSGRIIGKPAAYIERKIGWKGNPGECLQALIDVRFLKRCKGGWVVHQWEEHEGHLEALRARNRANAQSRWDKMKAAKAMPLACQTDATGMPLLNLPPNTSLPPKRLTPRERAMEAIERKHLNGSDHRDQHR